MPVGPNLLSKHARSRAVTPASKRTTEPVIISMPDDVVVPRVKRRKSRLHGWGVFAMEDIPKNKRIIAYTGEKITHKESLAREHRYLDDGAIWCFLLNSRWVIDGHVGGNDSRFINHSCRPNCYTQILNGMIWVRAAKHISKGEELTYNYYTEGEGKIRCLCRPDCEAML